MIENKKIKKFEKINKSTTQRFKKSNLRPSRVQTGQIDKPCRLFEDCSLYVVESDLFFGMKDEKVIFDISLVNHFKYITSVEIRKDLSEKILTLLLETKLNQSISSWHTVANDFEASESPNIQKWAAPLRAFGTRYEAFMKEYAAMKKENNLQKRLMMHKMRQQAAAKRLYVLTTYPAFEIRYRLKKDEVKCSELCYNETFLKELGYTLESFTSTVLSEGIPQFLPGGLEPIDDMVKGLMENFLVGDIESPEQETEVLMKSGYRKKIIFQNVAFVEVSENELIFSHMLYIKKKSLPFGSYDKQPYAPEFLQLLQANDKEKEYLFNSYYGEKIKGLHSNTDKVCKIKELSP